MPDRFPTARLAITAAVLLGAIVLLSKTAVPGKPPGHQPLAALPLALGDWSGDELDMTQRLVDAAGVDDFANREYHDDAGNWLQLYIGYYNNQRTADLIHSPRNCLPAAGWETVQTGKLRVDIPSHAPIVVNDFLIAKGLQRQVVLYWYEGRGRTIASEYTSKFWMMGDALTRRRTDGALVRINIFIRENEANSRARAVAFLQALYPRLSEFVPN